MMLQFQTATELWRLTLTEDEKELRFAYLEWPEAERQKGRVAPQEELTEEQADVYWGWVVRRTVTVLVADLVGVREERGLIEYDGEEYHRLQVIVDRRVVDLDPDAGASVVLFSDFVGVDTERPWRDSRQEMHVLAGVRRMVAAIRRLLGPGPLPGTCPVPKQGRRLFWGGP